MSAQRELAKTTESVPQCVGLVHVCEIMGVGREKRRLKKHIDIMNKYTER